MGSLFPVDLSSMSSTVLLLFYDGVAVVLLFSFVSFLFKRVIQDNSCYQRFYFLCIELLKFLISILYCGQRRETKMKNWRLLMANQSCCVDFSGRVFDGFAFEFGVEFSSLCVEICDCTYSTFYGTLYKYSTTS